jgi:HEAT repeat protein
MCWSKRSVVVLALFASGCGKQSTNELIEQLKAPDTLTRLKAVRTLPERREEAAQVVPALIEALKDAESEIRRGAALGLGTFGAEAQSAIPALQVVLGDRDPSVRKAAASALSYIDPQRFPDPSKVRAAQKK